jgi:hypothetical protein
MVEYTCHKCKKVFKKKYSYDKHVARKNPCDRQIGSTLDNNHECKICDKIFSSYSSLHKHTKKNCKPDDIKVVNNKTSVAGYAYIEEICSDDNECVVVLTKF